MRNVGGLQYWTLVAVSALSLMMPTAASAGWIKDFVTDPLKLEKASDNARGAVRDIGAVVDRLNGYLNDLTDKVDGNILAYIDEINLTIDHVSRETQAGFDRADALLGNAEQSIERLQDKIFADTLRLVECSEELTKRNIYEVLAEAINRLNEARPCIKIFDWCIISVDANAASLEDPITEYTRWMQAYRARIAKVGENDDALIIPNALAEMQRVTLQVVCLYDKTSAKPGLLKTYASLRAEAEPWVGYQNFAMKHLMK